MESSRMKPISTAVTPKQTVKRTLVDDDAGGSPEQYSTPPQTNKALLNSSSSKRKTKAGDNFVYGGLRASEYADIVKYLKGGDVPAWFDDPHTWKFRSKELTFSLDVQGLLLRKGRYVLQDWESEAVLKKLHVDSGHMKTPLLYILSKGIFTFAGEPGAEIHRDFVRSITSCELCHGRRDDRSVSLSLYSKIDSDFAKLRCVVKPSDCGRGVKVVIEGIDEAEVKRHHEQLIKSAVTLSQSSARKRKGSFTSFTPRSKKQKSSSTTPSVIERLFPDRSRTTPVRRCQTVTSRPQPALLSVGGATVRTPAVTSSVSSPVTLPVLSSVTSPVTVPVTRPVQKIVERITQTAAIATKSPSMSTLERIKTEPSVVKSEPEEPVPTKRRPSIEWEDSSSSITNCSNTPSTGPEPRNTNKEQKKIPIAEEIENAPTPTTSNVPTKSSERNDPASFFVCTPSGNIKCPDGFAPSQPSHKITRKISADGKGQMLIRAFMAPHNGDVSTENMDPENLHEFDDSQSFISTEYGKVYIPEGYKCTNCGISENEEADALVIEIRLQLQKLR